MRQDIFQYDFAQVYPGSGRGVAAGLSPNMQTFRLAVAAYREALRTRNAMGGGGIGSQEELLSFVRRFLIDSAGVTTARELNDLTLGITFQLLCETPRNEEFAAVHAYAFDGVASGVGVDAGFGLPLSPALAWGREVPLSPERDTLYPWFASAASVFGGSLLSDDLQPSYYGGAQTAVGF